jgi:SAM-dependent methyltransferase
MDKEWYKSWFGNDYLTVYSHRDQNEARQVINLIRTHITIKDDFKILDLCCGPGRHALILAGLGYEVYGIDLSRTLLEIAKFHRGENQPAYFIQADMRQLPIRHNFDLLLNLFTSFGYFEADKENEGVFFQFHHVLKPGGYFIFDYFNRSHVVNHLIPYHQEQIEDVLIEQERFIKGERIQKVITLKREGNRTVFHESVKLYEPEQILCMMKKTNLHVLQVFGDYSGEPLTAESERFIVIGLRQ